MNLEQQKNNLQKLQVVKKKQKVTNLTPFSSKK